MDVTKHKIDYKWFLKNIKRFDEIRQEQMDGENYLVATILIPDDLEITMFSDRFHEDYSELLQ